MGTYETGDLADLIAGAQSEEREDLFKSKEEKCKATEDAEEIITSPIKKKKRKSIVRDNAIGDIDTPQKTATSARQKHKQEEEGDLYVEASAPQAERTSPNKKKKRKSIVEDNTIGDVDTPEKAATPPKQKHKQEEDGDPSVEVSTPQAERTSLDKKKKRKSIVGDDATGDVGTTEKVATPARQEHKQEEDGDPSVEASAPQAERTSPNKKKKRKSIEGKYAIDVDTPEKAATPARQKHKQEEDGDPSVEASALQAERTSPNKKKKRKSIVRDNDIGDVDTPEKATTPARQKHEQEENGDPSVEASSLQAERTSPNKKKKRKSIVGDNAIGDIDTPEKAATPARQKHEQEEDGDPSVEASAPQAERTSPNKKKKRKSIEGDNAIGYVYTPGKASTPAQQKHKQEEDGDPSVEASAPQAERTSSNKKKLKKSIVGDSAIGDVDTPQKAATPARQKHKQEDGDPSVEASALQAERSVPKKIESKQCGDVTQSVEGQEMDEVSEGGRQENSDKEPDGEDASQKEMPKEDCSSGLKPSKKKLKSTLQKKVTTRKENQNSTALMSEKDLSKKPEQEDNFLKKFEKENQIRDAKNDKDTSEKPVVKKNKLTAREKKLLKQNKISESIKNSLPAKHPDAEERTVFVGNVGLKTKRKTLAQLFRKYGEVETVRLRNVAVAAPNISKKEAVAKGMFHPKRTSLNAYVRFANKESVEKALEANGLELQDHHLIVNRSKKNSEKREHAAFVGNLPWEAEEEALYKHFSNCGAIASVRIIRDKMLGSGKGFGYVNFKSHDALEVALQLSGKEFGGRALRVKRAVKKVKAKKDFGPKQRERVPPGQHPKMKLNFMKKNKGKQLEKEEFARKQKKIDFSGVKTSKEGPFKKGKRMKFNKDDKRKAFIAQKLAGDGSSACIGGPKSKSFPKSASPNPMNNAE